MSPGGIKSPSGEIKSRSGISHQTVTLHTGKKGRTGGREVAKEGWRGMGEREEEE